MRSISMKLKSSKYITAALTAAAVIGGVMQAEAQTKPEAQGAWGGKSLGAGEYADVNGIKLYYETQGAGKPLILLHGGLGSLEMFGPNLPALAKGRQLIAVDLQGHGRTADIDRPIDVRYMADDIAALIKYLKLDHPDIVGYSLGGGVALMMAIHHSDVVGKVVSASAPIRRTAFYPDILAQQVQVSGDMLEQMKQTPMYQLYTSIAPRPQDFGRLLTKMGEYMKKDFDFSKEVAAIKVPVMIVAADADMFPPSHAIEIFELLGGGKKDGGWDGSGQTQNRLAIIPGMTHYSLFAQPALAAAVIPFLDEPARKR